MRENMGLFRGKRIDNGEWAEGSYRHEKVGGYITAVFITEDLTSGVCEHHRVIPDTVGECTGLRDKNGKLIWEGNIVNIHAPNGFDMTGVVVYYDCGFEVWDEENGAYECLWYSPSDISIIGNIHDNGGLLKEGADNGRNN